MRVEYEFDQDPRYGWASINLEGQTTGLIVVHCENSGSRGFTFCKGVMTPTCICHAWNKSECSCPDVEWPDID